MKDLLKNKIILGAIAFFVVVIGTISILLSGSSETLILQPGAGQIIDDTLGEIESVLNEVPEIAQETDEIIPEAPSEEESSDELGDIGGLMIDAEYVMGDIILNDFGPMMSITSPLTLTGKAPRVWFFEGIFPVTLMSLEGGVITESYASGDWLSPVGDSEELGADNMIEFSATIDFEIPTDSTGEAKIRFTKDNTSGEGEDIYVEEQVIFAE